MLFHKHKTLFIVLLTAMLFCLLPCGVSADSAAYQAVISVKLIDPHQTIPANTQFHLVMESKNKHAPLPVPNELIVGKSGTFTFSPIEFTEPGVYRYVVKELAQADDSILCDTSEYEITVTVIRGENGHLEGTYMLSLEDSSTKPTEISFRNVCKTAGGGSVFPFDVSSDDSSDSPDQSPAGTSSGGSDQSPADTSSDGSDNSPADASSDTLSTPGTGEGLSPAFVTLFLSGAAVAVLCLRRQRQRKPAAD